MRDALRGEIKERLVEEAKMQIVKFFQKSKEKNLKQKYRHIIGKKSIRTDNDDSDVISSSSEEINTSKNSKID